MYSSTVNEPTEVSNVTYVGEGPDMVMKGCGGPVGFKPVELAATDWIRLNYRYSLAKSNFFYKSPDVIDECRIKKKCTKRTAEPVMIESIELTKTNGLGITKRTINPLAFPPRQFTTKHLIPLIKAYLMNAFRNQLAQLSKFQRTHYPLFFSLYA